MPAELSEYEIEDKNGIVTTVQLTDEDAKKRFPNARKVGRAGGGASAAQTSAPKSDESAPSPGVHQQHTDVKNRARR